MAVDDTLKGHSKQRAVIEFEEDREGNIREILASLHDGTWREYISYRELTGRTEAREYHGNVLGIVTWFAELEKTYGRSFLPLEDGEIVNECGYIYKGSTNRIEYIDESNYGK